MQTCRAVSMGLASAFCPHRAALPLAIGHAGQTVCGGQCCNPEKCYTNNFAERKCCGSDSE